MPQVAKTTPADRMPARVPRHLYGEPGAPDRGRQRGVLADTGGHGIDSADPLQVGAAQQHGLADADPLAKAVSCDQPARPTAVEKSGFELAAKAPWLGRDRHGGQEPDPRRQLAGEAAQLIRSKSRVDVADQNKLMPSPAPGAAQIIEFGVDRGACWVGCQPRRHIRTTGHDALDERDGWIARVRGGKDDLKRGVILRDQRFHVGGDRGIGVLDRHHDRDRRTQVGREPAALREQAKRDAGQVDEHRQRPPRTQHPGEPASHRQFDALTPAHRRYS